jgi:ATP-dependent Clp endopeptidase proteolytic subunit ClpP
LKRKNGRDKRCFHDGALTLHHALLKRYDAFLICRRLKIEAILQKLKWAEKTRNKKMNRFFNMIAGNDGCCILLYGEIGEGVSAGDVARDLVEAEALYGKIDVRINSYGGDAMAGIAIFNALRNSKADITIYIDGVAASIASVIASCGKPVMMSRYAKLMLHNVSGGVFGNTKEVESYVDIMKKIEKTLIGIYSEKTGMTEEEISSRYFDGKDHWLSAEEALRLKFIDGIYDADPVPEESTPEQIYTIFNNRLNTNHKNGMTMFEQLKKRKLFAGCADEASAEEVITELEAKAAMADALKDENRKLKEANEAYEKKEKEAHEAEIETLVDTARLEERISAEEVETFKNVLRNDFANGKKLLDARKGKKRVIQSLGLQKGPELSLWETRMAEIKNNLKK